MIPLYTTFASALAFLYISISNDCTLAFWKTGSFDIDLIVYFGVDVGERLIAFFIHLIPLVLGLHSVSTSRTCRYTIDYGKFFASLHSFRNRIVRGS